MKVILISGKMRHGKDTFANELKKQLEENNKRVLIVHYGDYLKYCLKEYYGWDGIKDEKGRTLLQHFGTEIVRAKDENFWVDTVARLISAIKEEWDYVLIPDVRMPNEIDRIYDFFSWDEITTVRIERWIDPNTPYTDPTSTRAQREHYSETALDNYAFQYIIENYHLWAMYDVVNNFIKEINSF